MGMRNSRIDLEHSPFSLFSGGAEGGPWVLWGSRLLEPCVTLSLHRPAAAAASGSLLRRRNSGLTPDLLNESLHLSRVPQWFMIT